KKWFPLESNPDVINAYIAGMGVDVDRHCFVDVLSCEEWALQMVPRPVLGVLLLYPVQEDAAAAGAAAAAAAAPATPLVDGAGDRVYYMKQTVSNACGTVAVLHAVGNALAVAGVEGGLQLGRGSFLERFYGATKHMTADELGTYLCEDRALETCHAAAAVEGQSEQIEHSATVDMHFACLSCIDGCLYELDGRKPSPINHGECSTSEVLEKACGVVKGFMARNPDDMRFSILALAAVPL
ncbi:unnamed protein product, partial [Ectocarpus fasciculatus]